jgi:hypothetical protein
VPTSKFRSWLSCARVHDDPVSYACPEGHECDIRLENGTSIHFNKVPQHRYLLLHQYHLFIVVISNPSTFLRKWLLNCAVLICVLLRRARSSWGTRWRVTRNNAGCARSQPLGYDLRTRRPSARATFQNVQVHRVRVSYRSHLVAPISHDRDERPAPSTVGVWLTFQPARNPRLMAARRADARNRAFG